MKTTFVVLCCRRKQHATKLIDVKRHFKELMMRKLLYFCQLVRIDDVTPSLK